MNACLKGVIYIIRQGDTFYSISRLFHIVAEDLITANPYVDFKNLKIRQLICILNGNHHVFP
ncbi:LysM domain-containing protein [Priestia megaterium]|uniref:LysM peptidoglycan-binding domain-containing protein n=1 Tax=Priestia megaterium TaxID=1404 RepID=UPI0035B6680A